MQNDHRYDDIIGLAHHVSDTRSQMPIRDRAAQFAPFAALTGHDAAIRETARLTDTKQELDEAAKAALDERLRYLLARAGERPLAVFTHFVPDQKKPGGAYVSTSGTIKNIDFIENQVTLTDGTVIAIENISQIDAALLTDWDNEGV